MRRALRHVAGAWAVPLSLALCAPPAGLDAQDLDRVLISRSLHADATALPADRGAAGVWHRLLAVTTTASVLHVTAHPDDEHADLLTWLSRDQGVRTALLTLNRGEGGANAIGPELFDGVGVIRTEELRLSGRYYGLDDQYFTTAVDYGFSKTLDEAYRSWDRDALLADMVRVIRVNRPLVVVSRWHGSTRDGHGHHQAAGDLTPEAVRAAADPERFPEQIRDEGLRPWQARRLFRGGVADGEFYQVEVPTDGYSPWLGTTYRAYAAEGLSLQRSQTSGRIRSTAAAPPRRYERLPAFEGDSVPGLTADGFFDGLDTSLTGVFDLTGEDAPAAVAPALDRAARHIARVVDRFDAARPSDLVPDLGAALAAVREALAATDPATDAAFLLAIEARQLEAALTTAAGIDVRSEAIDPEDDAGPGFLPPTLGPVVAGQDLMVWTSVEAPDGVLDGPPSVRLLAPDGWRVTADKDAAPDSTGLLRARHLVGLPLSTPPTRPPLHRDDPRDNVYQVTDSAHLHLPWTPAPLVAEVTVPLGGVPVHVREAVRTREADVPYGYAFRELTVLPTLSVAVTPPALVAPLASGDAPLTVQVRVTHAGLEPTRGSLRLDRPQGWIVDPATHELAFDGPGQTRTYAFTLTPRDLADRSYPVVAVATAGGRTYREGYETIRHRDLETRYLYGPARATVRGLDVTVPPDLSVGYVMGVGDRVPDAIAQLGAGVTLLDDGDLTGGDLSVYDAVVVGTRAYAVRPALYAANPRLLAYVEGGGHLVVLYQTQEFVPAGTAPYPATLPSDAQEVSEEDAPVRLLAPDHPLLTRPNRIVPSHFDGWIEQRGSKFMATWDEAYTPLMETHDRGQDDQRGVWLTAEHGAGRYTYCALALHRQLPAGVPGAYVILANLISAGR